jgi:CheY-like chemotaxis protein
VKTNPLDILLAEDDDGHAFLVQTNLKRAGIVNPISRVRDGQEALDYVFCLGEFADREVGQPLLMILDINMPRVDGVEVLTKIKKDPATSSMPVIMLTTTDDPREVENCY